MRSVDIQLSQNWRYPLGDDHTFHWTIFQVERSCTGDRRMESKSQGLYIHVTCKYILWLNAHQSESFQDLIEKKGKLTEILNYRSGSISSRYYMVSAPGSSRRFCWYNYWRYSGTAGTYSTGPAKEWLWGWASFIPSWPSVKSSPVILFTTIGMSLSKIADASILQVSTSAPAPSMPLRISSSCCYLSFAFGRWIWAKAVDGPWRLSSCLVLCKCVLAPSVQSNWWDCVRWYEALVRPPRLWYDWHMQHNFTKPLKTLPTTFTCPVSGAFLRSEQVSWPGASQHCLGSTVISATSGGIAQGDPEDTAGECHLGTNQMATLNNPLRTYLKTASSGIRRLRNPTPLQSICIHWPLFWVTRNQYTTLRTQCWRVDTTERIDTTNKEQCPTFPADIDRVSASLQRCSALCMTSDSDRRFGHVYYGVLGINWTVKAHKARRICKGVNT